jgi:hypothetical protein
MWLIQQLASLLKDWGWGYGREERSLAQEAGMLREGRDQCSSGVYKHQQQQVQLCGKQRGVAGGLSNRVPSPPMQAPPPAAAAAVAAGSDGGCSLQEQTLQLLQLVAGEGQSKDLDVTLLEAQQELYNAAYEALCR